jgi:RNA polymerase sigma factor (sigma-70 family)
MKMAARLEHSEPERERSVNEQPGAPLELDHAAFVRELFLTLAGPLRTYLRGVLRHDSDAEDVLQEAYARLLGKTDLEQRDNRARAYLFRIATNLAFDRLRRRRTRGIEQPMEMEDLPSREPTPDRLLDLEQGRAIVRRAVLGMDARTRQVFVLRAHEHLSYDEIARRLGVGKRTVERAMRDALDHCQRELRGYTDDS